MALSYIIHPLTHPPLPLHLLKYKQTYTLISKLTTTASQASHCILTQPPQLSQVNKTFPQTTTTMAASDFTNTGAPVDAFTQSRGYRDKMCALQGRGHLDISTCVLQGRGTLDNSTCTLQGKGRGTLDISTCSLMRN